MSGADEARDAIHRVLHAFYTPVYAAGATYAKAQKAAMIITDIEDTMSRTVELIIAAETLKEAAEAAEKSARAALATAIQDTGAPEVITLHHKAYLARKAAFVSVDQPDMVPEGYWNKPTPDRAAIKKAIEAGDDVPGATLVRPNDSSLVIRARK